jgi:hypothetical protein
MNKSDEKYAELWRRTVGNIKCGADRIQATADAFPSENASLTMQDAEILFARHAAALADHTVAVNCLFHIMAEHL